MTTIPKPASEHTAAQNTKQPLEAYPKLAGMIENIGWKATGLSLSTWGAFLAEINAALTESRASAIEDCARQLEGSAAINYSDDDDSAARIALQIAAKHIRTASEVVDRQPAMPVNVEELVKFVAAAWAEIGSIQKTIEETIERRAVLAGRLESSGEARAIAQALLAQFVVTRK